MYFIIFPYTFLPSITPLKTTDRLFFRSIISLASFAISVAVFTHIPTSALCNDGASFTIVASEDAVKKYNLTPIAEVIGFGQGGVDPRVMGLGPTPAILNALKYADLKIEDLDLVELNEAFAAQSLGVIHELEEATGMDREAFLAKTNVNGGAIALGHPVGASGNRILVSLLYEMQKRKSKIGLASLCIGGGQGAAVIVKMCD